MMSVELVEKEIEGIEDMTVSSEWDHLIPKVDPNYVRWGNYDDIQTVVSSGKFFPVAISGMSGNGKTLMVKQVCAATKRHLIRINISKATTESDLIGGFRLQNGDTVWEDGPVITAMKLGAVLLIDEFDRGHPGEMVCLHSVLEGESYYIKKTNMLVSPTPGFTVIGTANTKGRGSSDGRYIAASVQDDALMERFSVWFDQEYPPRIVEADILLRLFESMGYEINKGHKEFYYIQTLTAWAENLRKSFIADGIDDFITTRRLCSIAVYYDVIKDFRKAVRACLSKFDTEIVDAMTKEFELRCKSDKQIEAEIRAYTHPAVATAKTTPAFGRYYDEDGVDVGQYDSPSVDVSSVKGFNISKNDDSDLKVEEMAIF